jgi:hypothetical protein
MSVPSKAEFHEAIAILANEYSNPHHDSLLVEVTDETTPMSHRRKVVEDFVADYLNFQSDNWYRDFKQTSVHKWLAAQPSMTTVDNLMFTGTKRSLSQQATNYKAGLTDWLLGRLETSPEWFRHGIYKKDLNRHQRWYAMFCEALCEYHYENGVDLMAAKMQRILRFRQQIAILDDEYRSLISSFEKEKYVRLFLYERNHVVPPFLLKNTDKVCNLLPRIKNVPLKKEHLFIWRMIEASRYSRLKARSSSIVEIFALEGFENRPDDRTIERIFAKYRQKNQKNEG